MDEAERLMFLGWAKLPVFQGKIRQAQATIRDALKIGLPYVGISWGKDSVVLLHLAQQIKPDIQVIFWTAPDQELLNNYQETRDSYLSRYPTNYLEIDIDGDRVPHKVAKSKPWEQWPVALVGIRAEENRRTRGTALRKFGLLHQYTSGPQAGTWRAAPLGWWGWKDVWAYTCLHGLPYLRTYDDTFAVGRDRSRTCNLVASNPSGATIGRLQILKRQAPEYWQKLQERAPWICS